MQIFCLASVSWKNEKNRHGFTFRLGLLKSTVVKSTSHCLMIIACLDVLLRSPLNLSELGQSSDFKPFKP